MKIKRIKSTLKKLLLTLIASMAILCIYNINNVVHAKIEVTVDRIYTIDPKGYMEVDESYTFENKTNNLYIPGSEELIFHIVKFTDTENTDIEKEILQSLTLRESNSKLEYEIENTEGYTKIITTYGNSLLPSQKKRINMKFIHPGLVFENGRLIDAYINAFAQDFDFETATFKYIYNTTLRAPRSMKEINFVHPTPTKSIQEAHYNTFFFSQESLIDQFVWIQFGNSQLFEFEIIQPTSPSESKITGNTDIYEILLPLDFKGPQVSQTIYFSSITPKPKSVKKDSEGNLIATFEVDSYKNSEIKINGYAEIIIEDNINFGETVQNKSEVPNELKQKYTSSARYWESNSPEIKTKAYELLSENVYLNSLDIYNYIINTIDYSDIKRFGINERQGALNTLRGKAAVCMEYSDLFIALARASDIPTRAVFGYGFDNRVNDIQGEPHQWVQVYMPGLENPWVDVDVTWGESGDELFGGDLNHFYTHIAYEDPNTPSVVTRYSNSTVNNLQEPKYNINTTKRNVNLESLDSTTEILREYPQITTASFDDIINVVHKKLNAAFISYREGGIDMQNDAQILFGIILATTLVLTGSSIVLIRKIMDKTFYSDRLG